MNKRWKIIVELTFDRDPNLDASELSGASQEAFFKVRPELESILGEGKFAHYHIVQLPSPCLEFD